MGKHGLIRENAEFGIPVPGSRLAPDPPGRHRKALRAHARADGPRRVVRGALAAIGDLMASLEWDTLAGPSIVKGAAVGIFEGSYLEGSMTPARLSPRGWGVM